MAWLTFVMTLASGTVAGERLMLGCFGTVDDFNLLHRRGRILRIDRYRATTTRTLLERILREPVQFVLGHCGTNRSLMTLLAAFLAFPGRLSRPDGLDDVRRRRLGAIGGVLGRGGQLGGHFVEFCSRFVQLCSRFIELLDHSVKLPLQLGEASLPAFTVRTSISRAHGRRF